MLAITKTLPSQCVHVPSDLEIVWAIIQFSHGKVVGICYCPPASSLSFINELHDAINIVKSRHPSAPLLLIGDFNIPNISWATEPHTISPFSTFANDFLNLCSVFSLSQLVKQPTRTTASVANTLDLVLSSHSDFVSNITHLPGLSDHTLLSFNINASCPKRVKTVKTIHDYGKADFVSINNELCTFLDSFLSTFDSRSVQTNWDIFVDKVKQLTNKHIPVRAITSNQNAPWFNIQIKRLLNKKHRIYKAVKKSSCIFRWDDYKKASQEYTALKNAKYCYFNTTLPNMLLTDPKKFWHVINPKDSEMLTLIDSAENTIPPHLCAEALNDAFSRNFSATTDAPVPTTPHCDYYPPMPPIIIIDYIGVESVLKAFLVSWV